MKTVPEALQEFISNLELTEAERNNAQRQQNAVREVLRRQLKGDEDFLSGSYARKTAIRPLNDIDFLFMLDASAHEALKKSGPKACLKAIRKALHEAYPNKELPLLQDHSVNITFSQPPIGYDVVPAFRDGQTDNYVIPERETNCWIKTNPRVHQEFSTAANEKAGKKLKPLIKALKHWNVRNNVQNGKPVRSFHLEVMACRVFELPPANYLKGLHTLFDELAKKVDQPCPEPAKLGPKLDAHMSSDKRQRARDLFASAATKVDEAIEHVEADRTARAHYLLRDLFGPEYPEKGER